MAKDWGWPEGAGLQSSGREWPPSDESWELAGDQLKAALVAAFNWAPSGRNVFLQKGKTVSARVERRASDKK